jgi:hypothetical protein
MELLRLREIACYRCGRTRLGVIEPFRSDCALQRRWPSVELAFPGQPATTYRRSLDDARAGLRPPIRRCGATSSLGVARAEDVALDSRATMVLPIVPGRRGAPRACAQGAPARCVHGRTFGEPVRRRRGSQRLARREPGAYARPAVMSYCR